MTNHKNQEISLDPKMDPKTVTFLCTHMMHLTCHFVCRFIDFHQMLTKIMTETDSHLTVKHALSGISHKH